MSRDRSRSIVVSLLLIPLALACRNRSSLPSQEVASTAVASTPSPTSTADSAPTGVAADNGPVVYEDAERAFHRGSYGEAEQLFAGYRRQHPDNPWGHYMYGLSAWKAGQHASRGSASESPVAAATMATLRAVFPCRYCSTPRS